MKSNKIVKLFMLLFLVVIAIIFSSVKSTKIWSDKPEKIELNRKEVIIEENITVENFGIQNDLPNESLKKIFSLRSEEELKKDIHSFGFTDTQLKEKINKTLTVESEHESKNWNKIRSKFILWFIFMGIIFAMLKNNKISYKNRKWIYAMSVLLFGIILGSDPSPMGTVKDAIVLFGIKRIVFPPRIIAFTVFISTIVFANKFICSWGCQLGVLQDLIFRLNRNAKDKDGLIRQFKPSFLLSNIIRILFFILITLSAFLWSMDIIGFIDPFKIFNPSAIGLISGIFIGVIIFLSLFIYRPWCHFFCPFGLIGWIFEKVSLFKINVHYDKCIGCGDCAKACPSTTMEAILKQEKRVIPDCFSCGNCIEACPTKAIHFESAKRNISQKENSIHN